MIYDLCCNIYLSTIKGNSKTPKGPLNESSFLTGGKALTLKHTIPLQMHFQRQWFLSKIKPQESPHSTLPQTFTGEPRQETAVLGRGPTCPQPLNYS